LNSTNYLYIKNFSTPKQLSFNQNGGRSSYETQA